MYVVCKTNMYSVLEVEEIMFMKLYIHFGELNVSLTSGLWVSAAGVAADKPALPIPVTWEKKLMKDAMMKCCFVMSVDFGFGPI